MHNRRKELCSNEDQYNIISFNTNSQKRHPQGLSENKAHILHAVLKVQTRHRVDSYIN